MACCLTAPIHYLNQCWRAINEILWHSLQGNKYTNIQDINPKVVFEIYTVEILAILPRDQRVNDTLKIDCQRHFAGEARSFNPGKVITKVLKLAHRGPDKMAAILHTTYSKRFYRFKILLMLFKFDWTLLQGLHWLNLALVWIRAWRGTIGAFLLTHIYVTGPWCVKCWSIKAD